MSVKWTPAQEKAIYDTGGSLLLSAAAGSGKTAVLVERAVQLIAREKSPIPADALLIVTFTNAAAEELRSRIASRVEEEMRAHPSNSNLRRQRILLRKADICTIDAFCVQMVKENFVRLNLPPDISIGDEALISQLSATAIAEVMEEMHTLPQFAEFATLYGRARTDTPAEKAALALFSFTRTLPFPEKVLQGFCDMYSADIPLCDTLWAGELFVYAKNAATAAKEQIENAVSICMQEDFMAYLPALEEVLVSFAMLLQHIENKNWDACYTEVQNFAFSRFGTVRGGDDVYKNTVKSLRDDAKKILEDLCKYCFVCTQQEFYEDRAAALPMVNALCSAANLYSEKFYAAKVAEKVLDFSDVEQLALGLLLDENQNKTEIARNISHRYAAVMVDEYQDTNELQDAIYHALANHNADNLFYVGDVKQSIYRFRKANPGIFMQKKNSWHKHETGLHPAVLTLGHNFRSEIGVISGVNYIFSALMSESLGEIEYTDDEKLILGGEAGSANGLEICIVEDPEKQGDAQFVADKIQTMLKNGFEVNEKGILRPCNYGDFCVLLRSRTAMQSYVAALEAREIPVVCDAAENLLETPEVLPLIAMLAVVDNPGDDVNLAAALLGPVYRFTLDDLSRLRAAFPTGRLWGALAASGEEKALRFVESIRFYRALAGEVSAGRLCEEFVQRTGYFSAVCAMEGGSARKENLQRFIGWASGLSGNGRGGLAGFMRLVRAGKSPANTSGKTVPGHVNILTIHKSKGLEFPVCILADTTRRFNKMDLNNKLQLHTQQGLGLCLRSGELVYATLPHRAIRHRSETETLSEEMRVLYVALTRAKQKMIVCAASETPQKLLSDKTALLLTQPASAFLLSRQRCFADWVLLAALCHPSAENILQHAGGQIPPHIDADGEILIGVFAQPAPPSTIAENKAGLAPADEHLVQEIQNSFAQQNPRRHLSKVPIKVSVSELSKPDMPAIRRRPSFMYKEGLTSAEKGTAQHEFMQYANFTAAQKSITAEIQRLVGGGYMDSVIAEKLDTDGIQVFLASPLAQRFTQANKVLKEQDFISSLPAEALIKPSTMPTQGTTVPIQGETVPIQGENMPIQSENMPIQGHKQGETVPIQGKNMPIQGENMPIQGENMPIQRHKQDKTVLVQGVADAVLVFKDHIELVDYKTDRGKTPSQLVALYSKQLSIYRTALQKRFNVPINKLTIWAFALGKEIDVPIG